MTVPTRASAQKGPTRAMGTRVVFLLVVSLTWAASAGVDAQRVAQPGNPLAGLTPHEMEAFTLGLEDFLEVEDAEEGLGPAFNGRSCAECHNIPAVGGISPVTEVRAGRRMADGSFQDFDEARGSLFQLFSVPNHRCQSVIPSDANVIARRAPIPLFGAGLVEAIPDATIVALEDPDDIDGDGISGRAAWVTDRVTGDQRVGRFGWKAQVATLLEFGADAYRNEMGITNALFKEELTFELSDEQLRLCDPIPDPEDIPEPATGLRGIDNFESFMKFLAPIERGPISPSALAGEEVFMAVGCASCHVPTLTTGPSVSPLFDRRPVPLYSDLLLHDIGTGDGIRQAAGQPTEIRTPALWGLRVRRPLLHDGRAATIADALLAHRGEARATIARLVTLSPNALPDLIAFLDSL